MMASAHCPSSHGVLTLVRHPETLANAARVRQGSTDSPLSPRGESQLTALARHWEASSSAVPITLVASSPLSRARRVGEALVTRQVPQRANGESPSTSVLPIEVRPDLAEQSFGPQENFRAGKHVPEFPRGQGAYESRDHFKARVKREGDFWIRRMVEALSDQECPASASPSEEPASKRARTDHGLFSSSSTESIDLTANVASSTSTQGPQAPRAPHGTPHYVLVTHGLWLSTFLHLFTPPRAGDRVPFASNTGVFTLQLSLLPSEPAPPLSAHSSPTISLPPSDRPPLRTHTHKRARDGSQVRFSLSLIRANAVDHLPGASGGGERERRQIQQPEPDPKQRRLDSFFVKKAGPSPRRA